MNRFTYSVIFLLFSVPIFGQGDQALKDLSRARYIIDNHSPLDFLLLEGNQILDLSGIEEDESIELSSLSNRKSNIPFLGSVIMTESGDIYEMDINDTLIRYGKRLVKLDQPINIQSPLKEQKTTGYTVVFSPEEMETNALNQLPIRPDSIKVLITAIIKDSDWSDFALKHKAPFLDNRSFSREMEIDRSIHIKIEPFGWTSVNNIAPMIDWDVNYIIEQRFFIAEEIRVPYAILDKRNNEQSIAVLDFSESTKPLLKVSGVPQITAVPNPVINDVRFEIANVPQGAYTIKIKNILGEIKIKKSIEFSMSDAFPVNIDALRKGSYFYALEDDQGNVLSTKRLIVLKP